MAAAMATTDYQHGPLYGIFDEKYPRELRLPRSVPPVDSLGETEDTGAGLRQMGIYSACHV